MLLGLLSLLVLSGLFCSALAAKSVTVKWLGNTPAYLPGTTFGLPWPKGQYYFNITQFSANGSDPQTWPTAYWPDGSLKWTAHAIPHSDGASDQLLVTASSGNITKSRKSGLVTTESSDDITVNTGKLSVSFSKTGSSVINIIQTASGKIVGQNGQLVLLSQSGVDDDGSGSNSSIAHFAFVSKVENVTISNSGPVRTLITVRGTHETLDEGSHVAWLPFALRFYLYAKSDSIRVIHTFVYDGQADKDFIAGIGIRFQVPLTGDQLYDRHIRLAGVDGGILSEAVQGITGLRIDPGDNVTKAQFNGTRLPDLSTWTTLNTTSQLDYIPTFSDYSLAQLSPDGFTLKKRTKPGQGWIKIPGSTRSGGLAYLGGATKGGLAVGLRNFWKLYPTGLDIRNAASDVGELTVWIYSPVAEPLDLRPYHDDAGVETWAEQTDALTVTYEDWEPGFDTPYGVARTNEFYIYAFDTTPTHKHLSILTQHTDSPPVLFADPAYIKETKALGTYWAPPNYTNSAAAEIESHLDFLVNFYQGQVEDRRWYGFLDYGDFMHTYDSVRHQWRYDVGGYAWDNSELSPNLFFGNYFLRTGREDVWRFYEAETRHASEVDIYHLGKWKGLGARHGVQHWGDSGKQARISQSQYRKIFYYISGGDERVGETISETLDIDKTFLYLDPNRKVRIDNYTQTPKKTVGAISLGTDWSSLAASWLLEYERRGPRWVEAESKLSATLTGIANLKNGFITGSALRSPYNGTIYPPPADPNNEGYIFVTHLSAVFGLLEVIDEITEHYGEDNLPKGFQQAFLDYCYYYFASAAEQKARYGESWSDHALAQGTSRLLAYTAVKTGNATLAKKAWAEFHSNGDNGFNDTTATWVSTRLNGSEVLSPVDEAAWLSTNNAANYGLAAIVNLALVGEYIPGGSL